MNTIAKISVLLYIGDVLIGDVNSYAKNRRLSEWQKSEQENASCDQFSFEISWKKFQQIVAVRFDENPASLLRVGKTRVVLEEDGRPRFSGYLSSRPARSGSGSRQMLSLVFFEHFARLSGDVVCDPTNKMSPMRVFTNRPAHLYAQDLINEFKARALAAGEVINWVYGTVNVLGNKTITYKDFQTVSKAICDAMNNVSGAGKFDVVFRADPDDYTRQIIDILKPRGRRKDIIIQYPGDGVYKLWSSDYELEETNEYASEVLVSGNGQIGDEATGEDTAKLGASSNPEFAQEYCYFREYQPQSNLLSQSAVDEYAKKLLQQRDFSHQVPQIKLVGRDIAWGDAANDDNGLAIGDSFYLKETSDDGSDESGWMRIIGMETAWDDLGVATVEPSLIRSEVNE